MCCARELQHKKVPRGLIDGTAALRKYQRSHRQELDTRDVGCDHVVTEREEVVAEVQVARVDLEYQHQLHQREEGGEARRPYVDRSPARLRIKKPPIETSRVR